MMGVAPRTAGNRRPAQLVDLGYIGNALSGNAKYDVTKTYEKGYSAFVLIPWRHDYRLNVSCTNGDVVNLDNMMTFKIINCDPRKETSIRVWATFNTSNSVLCYGVKN